MVDAGMIETVAAVVILSATCIAAIYAMFRGHQRTYRCEYCGVLHAINCYRPEVDHSRESWMADYESRLRKCRSE